MRVGIYNRWLPTRGGGEKHMLAIAECLSAEHTVEVLTHQRVGKAELEEKLNVDLSRVSLRCIPDLPDERLAPFTADYDLFINASHMNFIPSRAPRSLMLVYFPTPVGLSPWGLFKRRVGLQLKRRFMVPDYTEGFYGPEDIAGRRYRWTKGRAKLTIPVPRGLRALKLRMMLSGFRPPGSSPVNAAFSIDGREIGRCRLEAAGASFAPYELIVREIASSPLALEIHADTFWPKGEVGWEEPRDLGVAIAAVEVTHPRYRLYRFLFERLFKELGVRLDNLPPKLCLDHLDTYDLICAISQFTCQWIKRYWHRESEVLYPPVDVEAFVPLEKRNMILSVGRFFAGSHNKKHIPMIRAFKDMVDDGLSGWDLCLAGGTTPGVVHQEYLDKVKDAAMGYPIRIYTDVSFSDLAELYGRSKIYWHASGYGEDVAREPIRFEHFGITTVEAMAAGCVPVVIGKAGQLEVVRHGVDGFQWQTLGQLRRYTMDLIHQEDLRQRMSRAAIQRSRLYSREAFEERLMRIMHRLGI